MLSGPGGPGGGDRRTYRAGRLLENAADIVPLSISARAIFMASLFAMDSVRQPDGMSLKKVKCPFRRFWERGSPGLRSMNIPG